MRKSKLYYDIASKLTKKEAKRSALEQMRVSNTGCCYIYNTKSQGWGISPDRIVTAVECWIVYFDGSIERVL